MRSLPAAITSELVKEAIMLRHLFKLVAASTYRWTDCDQDVYFDGQWWTAKGIKFSDITYSVDQNSSSTTVTIPNADYALSNIALAEDLKEKAFTIYLALLDVNLSVLGCAVEADLPIQFDGVVKSLPGGDRASFPLGLVSTGGAIKVRNPLRRYESRCGWAFKGTYCAYAGAETWCDLSITRCIALANQVNFGGWEYISDLQNQQIYWGQRVKTWGKK